MAGLIPQHFIDDILERVDIVDVIDRRVTLKKAGKNYTACCPFHDEKTPSFSVNPDKQFYYCFGCGAGGNSIGFLMDYENLDFPAAVEALAATVGLEVPREEISGDSNRQARSQTQGLYDVLAWASRFYQQQLRQHKDKQQAVDYLKQRGLSGEIARDFAIGFAPPGWDNLLNAVDQPDRDNSIRQLETCGMLVKKENGDYYDRFRNRIIFPIRDNRGRVIAFGGRVLGDDKPKYLNSPETPVFHKQRELYGLYEARKANRQLDYLLLVEGYMDVVALFQSGITNAVATLGTASSSYHLEKIFRHTSKLVVCFDGDEAGNKAAERLLETALPSMRDGRQIHFLFLPAGEDPDTFVRSQGKAALEQQIEQAMPLEQFLFESASKAIDLASDAGKAVFSQRALPLIQKIPAGVFRQLMLKKLAKSTGVTLELLEQQAGQLPVQRSSQSPGGRTGEAAATTSATSATSQPGAAATRRDAADNQALGMEKTPIVWAIAILLHYPDLARGIDSLPTRLGELQTAEARLLVQLFDYIRSREIAVSTHALLGRWHGTPEADALHNCANHHSPPEQAAIAKQELHDTLQKLDEHLVEAELQVFIEQLKDKPLDQLSDEERRKLSAIGGRRAAPKTGNDSA